MYIISINGYKRKSDSFQLIAFVVNLVLIIWCIVWCAQDSEPGTNKWGPNPKK